MRTELDEIGRLLAEDMLDAIQENSVEEIQSAVTQFVQALAIWLELQHDDAAVDTTMEMIGLEAARRRVVLGDLIKKGVKNFKQYELALSKQVG